MHLSPLNGKKLDEMTPLLFLPEDRGFAAQRYAWSSVELPTNGAPFLVHNFTGALPGDQYTDKS
jgi:hypothetical protein